MGEPPVPLYAIWLSKNARFQSPILSAHEESMDNVGMTCEVRKLWVQFGGDSWEQYVVKRVNTTCLDYSMSEREYRLYEDLAQRPFASSERQSQGPQVASTVLLGDAVRIPRCFYAHLSRTNFTAILECLEPPHWKRAHVAGCSWEQAVASVEALGRFHSHFAHGEEPPSKWGRLSWLRVLPTGPAHEERAAAYTRGFNAHEDFLRTRLSRTAFAAVRRLCVCLPDVSRRLARPPLTLVHGDWKLDNVRFSTEYPPAVAAFDWQFLCRCRGIYDLAYFIGLFDNADVRRRWEVDLCRRYLRAAGQRWAPRPPEFLNDMRAGLLYVFAFHVFGMGENPHHVNREEFYSSVMKRLGLALDSWGAGNLIGVHQPQTETVRQVSAAESSTENLQSGKLELVTRADKKPVTRTQSGVLFIAGTFADWKPVGMRWDGKQYVYRFTVGATGWESFQLQVGGRWDSAIYPSIADADPSKDYELRGPDDKNHGHNWTIVGVPKTHGLVVASVDAEGTVNHVSWRLDSEGELEPAPSGEAPLQNLSFQRPVDASSIKSPERAACCAVDGDNTTRWTSTYSDEQWLSVDLGDIHELSRVEICWEAAYAESYLLQGSINDETWTTMASERGREGWVATVLQPDSSARWVRMYGKKRATEYGFSIWDMRVYGTNKPTTRVSYFYG